MKTVCICPVCGGHTFSYSEILWEELVVDWQLSPTETAYINRQQGFICEGCKNNLRSMALAEAILSSFNFNGTIERFVETDFANTLKILEINEAGGLTPVLRKLPGHKLVNYPEYDMLQLAFSDETFDLVLHSDTLEHIPDPVSGLSECRRVLFRTGSCIFTVPIVFGRLTRSRAGLKKSYHGVAGQETDGCLVHNEFGADIWKFAIEAGFTTVRIHSLEYPSAIAIEATDKYDR